MRQRRCHWSCRLLLSLWTQTLLISCASTTYVFQEGRGGEVRSSVLINDNGYKKYLGELSPSVLAKRCPHGLQSLHLHYGLYAYLIGHFLSDRGVSGMDMDYRCLEVGSSKHAAADQSPVLDSWLEPKA